MYCFKAFRVWNRTFIDEKHEYRTGEILTHYLNQNFSKLEERYRKCIQLEKKVLYPYHASIEYDEVVREVQHFFSYVDALVTNLPPFNKIVRNWRSNELYKLLSSFPVLFPKENDEYDDESELILPDDVDLDDYDIDNMGKDPEERYRLKYKMEIENEEPDYKLRSDYSIPFYANSMEPLAIELNKRIQRLYDSYMTFAAEILRVPHLYSKFLDEYIHTGISLQDPAAVANAYSSFISYLNQENQNRKIEIFERLEGELDVSVTYGVLTLTGEKGEKSPILCRTTSYDGIGGFLYDELFEGLQTGLLPKRCKNCGRYFLLSSGYSTDFCENIAPNETTKTCRDIGARKKYDDKVKNDPIWLAYQRAYKAHYARVLKKKMSKSAFASWADMAIDLRSKALAGELEFDEYEHTLKK